MILALCAAAWAGTVTDATGATVTVARTDTLVVLSGGLTEAAYALGAGDRLVGTDVTSTFPAAARALPQLGYYRSLTAEGVLSLGADVVVAPDDAGPPAVLAQLRASGARVVILPGAPGVDAAAERITLLGRLLDAEPRAAALVAALRADLAAVRPADAPRVLFVYARSAGAMQVAGRDTAAGAMIALAGGENAVDAWSGYRPLTAEAVVAAAPDVILLTDHGLASVGGVDAVLAQPGVALTPAGRERRVVALDDLLLLGFGPRTGQGVAELAARLTP
ncbi:MAG: ABC transporter substrate-binding protein [Myxococcota bacterium]